jgi:ribose-phosphate pyrophosphokinase
MIQLIIDNVNIPVKKISFSDGSSNIKLEVPEGFKPLAYYSISVDPTTPADAYLWEIWLVQNAITNTFKDVAFNRRILHLPYLPHARADRVFEQGNPLPLQVFLGNIVKNFSAVHLVDPHSDYYKNFTWVEFNIKHQHQCFIEVVGNDIKSGDVLISPDKGASLKIGQLQLALDHRMIATTVIEAGKKRDITNGRVIETTLPEGTGLTGKVAWIIDDIADGGGTFIPLALKLKEAGAAKVNLYVTHGIFAKGLDILKGSIDNILTYQTIGTYVNRIDIDNFNKGVI